MGSRLKYSIIIPSKGGMPYLRFAVKSVLRQDFPDFELIVSVEESETEALQFLRSLGDKRLKTIHPPSELSMTEHWDWAQRHASGEWQMFLGQDDGVQGDFFLLLEELTAFAEKDGLRLITSVRAYIHWPGSALDPDGRGRIESVSEKRVEIINLREAAFDALLGEKSYFELPQMYTTSIFHRDSIEKCRRLQLGALLTCHPQDANLAALAIALEKIYLHSETPFGWVGTSRRSAGMAISSIGDVDSSPDDGTNELAAEYNASIYSSRLQYPAWAGNFALAVPRIYLWQALRQTARIQDSDLIARIESPLFIRKLIAKSWVSVAKNRKVFVRAELRRLAELNNVRLMPRFILYTIGFQLNQTVAWIWAQLVPLIKSLRATGLVRVRKQVLVGASGEPTDYPFTEGIVPLPQLEEV